MHAKVSSKFERLRGLLADRNLHVAATARKIDDVPTRSELIQYERRFNELHGQVGLKLEETRRYFEMYNTLGERQKLLNKQKNVLTSVMENFEKGMQSRQGKEQYLQQMEQIVIGLQQSLGMKRDAEKKVNTAKEKANAEHRRLVEAQRGYLAMVKEFQDECQKNERLEAELAARAR